MASMAMVVYQDEIVGVVVVAMVAQDTVAVGLPEALRAKDFIRGSLGHHPTG